MTEIYRLNSLGSGVLATDGIIRAADMHQIMGANTIVENAQAEAKRILAEANQVYQSEKERGHAEGLAQAAREQAAQILSEKATLERHLEAQERDLGVLVFDCVRRIIEGFDDRFVAEEITRSALSTMRDQRRGQLFVSEDSAEETRASLETLMSEFPEIELVDVVVDPELSAPNLRLETDMGVVNFVLNDTMEQLRTLLVSK